MIPDFPNFKKLEISDREEVERLTRKLPPYSDFNFVSMWSWDIHSSMGLSILNKNLVVLFEDYVSQTPFLSFIGENAIENTAITLAEFYMKNYGSGTLRLVPEEIATALPETSFSIKPDRDSYDYIYSVSHLANMSSWSKNSSGKKIRKFLRSESPYTTKHLAIREISKEEYLHLFKKWADGKNIDNHFEFSEYKAFNRFLQLEGKNIKFVSLYIKDSLCGFTAYEMTSNDFALSHFAKADLHSWGAAGDMLNWEEAKILQEKGIKYFNWEQDLGITGLRYAKEKYKHTFFLKKFVVNVLA